MVIPPAVAHLRGATTVTAAFLAAVDEEADRPFGWFADRSGTPRPLLWTELGDEAARFASGLRRAGVRPGEIVLLVLPPSPEIFSLFYGILLAGAVPSILAFPSPRVDPAVYWRYLQGLFEHSGARWIVTYPAFAAEAGNGSFARREGILDFRALLEGVKPLPASDAVLPSPGDILLLQHSSGTTGLHKGVALSHQAMLTQISILSGALQLDGNDVIASWLPLYHDMGLVACFLLPALARVPVVTLSPFDWVADPALLWRVAAERRATLCWLPNFALEILARFVPVRATERLDLSSLRLIINCSEVCRPSTHDAFAARYPSLGDRLAISYAMAENTFAVTQTRPGTPPFRDRILRAEFQERRRAVSCASTEPASLEFLGVGAALPGMEISIRDARGIPLDERLVGEIWIRSGCLLKGFHRRPDLDRELLRDGWYRTGDLGYLVGRELVVCGRSKEILIQGGRNFHASDIEAVVSAVPGVKGGRAVAFGVPSAETGTEDVVIVAERDAANPRDAAAIEAEIRRDVARHLDCVANEVRIVEERWLVKTTSGKISREENRKKYEECFAEGGDA